MKKEQKCVLLDLQRAFIILKNIHDLEKKLKCKDAREKVKKDKNSLFN